MIVRVTPIVSLYRERTVHSSEFKLGALAIVVGDVTPVALAHTIDKSGYYESR